MFHYKKNLKFDVENIVASDGFEYSGSSIISDILKNEGYVVSKNIRTDELFDNSNNFSWPRALDNQYTFKKRFILLIRIIKTIIVRIPLNIIQRTPIYTKYLIFKGRDNQMHEATSVNRSLWSYFVSIHLIITRQKYNEDLFNKWLVLKYWWQTKSNKNLALDNGIPRDKRISDWFFRLNGSIGIIVYRNPRIQYQQLVEASKSKKLSFPSYEKFCIGLEIQYQSIRWILDSNYKILFISFDKLLNDNVYRKKIETFFIKSNILNKFSYDFDNSIKNNNEISDLSMDTTQSRISLAIEKRLIKYHQLFEDKLYETIEK